ncbi:hypothetical protein [Actinomadura flavalba]|uniref:hypothetical protein n=1 Tax=Actinomadura flavalba TaxID=1120938 RepID=UPI0003676976|nr:hypothetical protein [Actinomadura flavalba]
MKITRVQALVLGVAALAVLGVVALLYVTVLAPAELRYPTQAKLRAGLPAAAEAELKQRGVALEGAVTCKDLPGWNKVRMRATCAGTTADKKPVQVIGTGDDESREHAFTILVDGAPVVENAGCLGPRCAAGR